MTSKRQGKSVVREYVEAIIIAIILALFIRTFIVQAFKIPSGSMLPTLKIGDHLLVSKFTYGVKVPFTGTMLVPLSKPESGDVVVFRFPKDRSIDYIKRVIGVPGDIITIKDKKLVINGEVVPDPHAHFTSTNIIGGKSSPRDNFGPVTVPKNHIFVMGDNRDNSYDGRFWGFVDQRDILGKAFILYWSWDLEKDLFSVDRLTSVRWNRIGNLIH